MAEDPSDFRPGGPRHYPAEKARQGEIILRRPWQRAVFVAGLAAFALFALFGSLWLLSAG